MHRRQSLQNRFRLHRKQKLQGQNPRDQLHSRTETTASSVREMARATVISVRAKVATIIAGTEMETEADLAREDHRAVRDVSEEKTEITVVKDALADRTTRVDSAPAVQEEAAADLTQSLHQS